jgi:uncharacterized protein YjdB
VGSELALVATGTYNDNTTGNITAQATWASSAPAVVTVDNSGNKGRLRGVAPGTAEVTAILSGVTGRVTVTVTTARLVRIDVTPANPSIARGTTQPFVATGTYDDNNTQDLTTQVTWTSSDTSIATISNTQGSQGVATAVAAGQTTITATLDNVSGTATLNVTDATLRSITITPPSPAIARGTTQPFVATGTYSDNTTQDLTTQVTWTSSDTSVATVSNTQGSQGVATAVAPGQTTITATATTTAGAVSGTTTLNVTSANLVSITITPPTLSLARGTTRTLVATGTYDDNTTQDLTTQVTWAAGDTSIAAVSNAPGSQGLVTALNLGQTPITATAGTVSGTASLNVTSALLVSLTITPPNPTLARDTQRRLAAIGAYTDNTTQDLTTQVTWVSSTPGVAPISNAPGSQGLVTALTPGQTTITAVLGATSATTRVTVTAARLVSISISPAAPTVYRGLTQTFTATGVYDDNTTQDLTTEVTWASSNPGIAAISNAAGSEGRARAISLGQTTIQASLGTISGATPLTVTAAPLISLAITPSAPRIANGTVQPFVATGTFANGTTQDLTTQVTWAAGDPSVASISNAQGTQGLATALAPGQTLISATLMGVTGSTQLTVTSAQLVSLTITPDNTTLPVNFRRQFQATGTFSDGSTQDLTTQVAWSSSDPFTADVTINTGLVSGFGPGPAVISASLGSVTDTTPITVSNARPVRLALTPPSVTLTAGEIQQFSAVATFDDNSTLDVSLDSFWTSSNPQVASIDDTGLARGISTGGGTVTITAAVAAVQATATLTVDPVQLRAITITPHNPIVERGTTLRFTATGDYADGQSRDITTQVLWGANDGTIASIDNSGVRGLARALSPGQTVVSANLSGITATTLLTVVNANLVGIDIVPAAPSTPRGIPLQLTAIGRFSDGRQQDLTGDVTWASADPTIVSFTRTPPPQVPDPPGLAIPGNEGQALVSATFGSVTASALFTVTAAVPVNLSFSPPLQSVQLALQDAWLLQAVLTYSDGSTSDVTGQASWGSSDPTLATVTTGPSASEELLTGLAPGNVTLTASYGGLTTQGQLTVAPYRVTSFAVTPANSGTAAGSTVQFTALARWSNGARVDATNRVQWSSSDASVASISNTPGTRGQVSALTPGQVTITARSLGGPATGSTPLTVR